MKSDYPPIAESNRLHARASNLVPAQTQTLAKGPGQFVRGVAPKFAARGKGSHLWDVDGNEYIDLQMGIGPISLGYAYEPVDRAIVEQLKRGITFSLPHALEVEVAELVRTVVPNADMVRYSKTGCDVTSAAVRLARAFTGRSKVLCCGYHGWHDWFISVTDRCRGVPDAVRDLAHTFDYNDLDGAEASIDGDTACVILEPTVFEAPHAGFLTGLRDLCDRTGALLVFDEMWTGFRLALGGAQERFDVRADLACFSKACANGMPLSLLTGRAEVMRLLERDVFFFTTFGGETLSLAAAQATIEHMRDNDVIGHLARQGKKLKDGVNRIAAELDIPYVRATGYDCRSIVTFDGDAGNPLELKSLVQQEMIRRGVLWGGVHNICFSHSDRDVAHILDAYGESLSVLKRAVAHGAVRAELRGEPVEPVFRKTSHFNTRPRPESSR